jgi:hypothetical protein
MGRSTASTGSRANAVRRPRPLRPRTPVHRHAPSSWLNPWVDSFNGRMRDEYLKDQQFDSLLEGQVLTEE